MNFSACFIILGPALGVFFLSDPLDILWLHYTLSHKRAPPPAFGPLRRKIGFFRAILKIRRSCLESATILHYKVLHFRIFFTALAVTLSGLYQALISADGTDFARSGAIVALIGLYSTFVGIRHQDAFSKAIGLIDNIELSRAIIQSEQQQYPQYLSSFAMFIITILGTLTWAYGDIPIQKVIDQRKLVVDKRRPEPDIVTRLDLSGPFTGNVLFPDHFFDTPTVNQQCVVDCKVRLPNPALPTKFGFGRLEKINLSRTSRRRSRAPARQSRVHRNTNQRGAYH